MIKKTTKGERSLRTIVASYDTDGGIYTLPTNDSAKFFGLIIMVTSVDNKSQTTAGGIVEKNFCIDFIESRLSLYTDIYTGYSGDIETLLKNILNSIYEKIYQERGFFPFNLCVLFLMENVLYFARIGDLVGYNIKDRVVEKIFFEHSAKVEVNKTVVGNGDYIFLCSKETSNCINRNEIRRYILYSQELQNASKELALLAGRYGEDINKSNLILKFTTSKKLSNTRSNYFTNRAITIYIVCLFLLGFTLILGDLAKMIGEQKATEIFRKRGQVVNIVEKIKEITPWEKKYLLIVEGFAVPYDVAEGRDKKLYIVDDKDNDVIVYNPKTKEINKLNAEINLVFPTAIRTTDDSIFIADFSILNSYIFQLDFSGDLIKKVPVRGDRIRLKNPKSIDFDDEGNWYVCDRGNNRIVKFDKNGRFVKIFRLKDYTSPNGIAYWQKGIIFYTSKDKNVLVRMTADGNEEAVKIYNEQREIKLSEPSSVSVDKNKNIFIADTGNNRVIGIKPTGELIEIIDKEKLEGLGSFPPKSVKFSKYSGSIFIVGSRTNNYNEINKSFCKGRIWQIIY